MGNRAKRRRSIRKSPNGTSPSWTIPNLISLNWISPIEFLRIEQLRIEHRLKSLWTQHHKFVAAICYYLCLRLKNTEAYLAIKMHIFSKVFGVALFYGYIFIHIKSSEKLIFKKWTYKVIKRTTGLIIIQNIQLCLNRASNDRTLEAV